MYRPSGFATVALIVVLAGCNRAPSAIEPTLLAIHDIGPTCGDGVRDNVPSGLYQWRCEGPIDNLNAVILVDGNDQGVASVTLVTREPVDPDATRTRFGRLVESVPPLDRHPGLTGALIGWSGGEQRIVVGDVSLFTVCDANQCIVRVTSAAGPLSPLP